MHAFSQGFLSDSMESVRAEVLKRHARWRELLLRVNALAVEAQHSATVDSSQPRALLAAAHFARVLASVQAAVIVLERGLVPQSKTLLRMALESLFALEALRLKPGLAADLAMTHEVDKRLIADRVLQWKDTELRTAVALRTSDDELRVLLSSKAREIKTYELAQHADMMDWYLSLYALFSFPAHGAVSDLIAHLEFDSYGNVVALKNEPEVERQDAPWAFATEILLKATESFVDVFSLPTTSMEGLKEELKSLSVAPDR